MKMSPSYHRKLDFHFLIAAILLIGTIIYSMYLSKPQSVDLTQPLNTIPQTIDGWQGSSMAFDYRTLINAGVNEYIMRLYNKQGNEPIWVYIGFYRSQQVGHTIHSPRHCYPGSGWEPISRSKRMIRINSAPYGRIEVNRYIVQNGPKKQLVYYWFHSRGRNITNEYWEKIYLVLDTIFKRRNDGSLIRISIGIQRSQRESEDILEAFIDQLYPYMMRSLPQ